MKKPYEVNLKAKLEIMMLHEKMDLLPEKQSLELMAVQTEQIDLIVVQENGSRVEFSAENLVK